MKSKSSSSRLFSIPVEEIIVESMLHKMPNLNERHKILKTVPQTSFETQTSVAGYPEYMWAQGPASSGC